MVFTNTASPAWIEAISTLGTLIVALLAAGYAIREHRNARETLIHNMRSEWRRLHESWARILLAEHGHDFHYADATPEERARFEWIHAALKTEGLEPGYSAALELRSDVRPVTRFISYAADSVLRGRWRMSEAYEVFGPDFARHHKTLRVLAHRDGRSDWLNDSTEFNNYDEQDCVFLFSFLLRAEQCRRGDTHAHFIVELAEEMRGTFKDELRRCSRRVRLNRHRLWLPLRVLLLMRRGRHPRVAAAFMIPEEAIVHTHQHEFFRRPLEPIALTRARISVAKERSRQASPG